MTYDPVTQRTLLFGGSGNLGDAWAWGDRFWTQIGRFGPSGRKGHSLNYETARQRAVLFGGYAASGAVADTWEFDGTD